MLDLPPPLWMPAKPAVIRPADPEMLHHPTAQQTLQALTVGARRHRGRRAAAGSLSLTQKGYGHIYDTGATASLALSYGSVDGGSAPAAGDLVCWFVLAWDSAATPVVDLSGSGWTQSSRYDSLEAASILTKVVVAGDVSSPPNVVTSPTGGSIGFWVAYTVTGSVTSLSILPSPINHEMSQSPNTANQTCDSSGIGATEIAITLGVGGGDDGSPSLAISGATADVTVTSAANQWGEFGITETRFMVNMTVGGVNITFSKTDDANYNHMASGYITVS